MARKREVRRRGRGWTVEAGEPDGWVQMSGAEACCVVSGAESLDRTLRRKATSALEAGRNGRQRMRRLFR